MTWPTWNALTVSCSWRHRAAKLSNVELDDDIKPASSHSALTTLEGNGEEIKIRATTCHLRLGGHGEFAYFIGWAHVRADRADAGKHVRGVRRATTTVVDYSRAVTGGLFAAVGGSAGELASRSPWRPWRADDAAPATAEVPAQE